jgi:hypothetical protein
MKQGYLAGFIYNAKVFMPYNKKTSLDGGLNNFVQWYSSD